MMKPPYDLSSEILNLIASISEKLGEVKANFLNKTSPQLRKSSKIKTIHSSLSIEGNTLSEEQITAILENKSVIGPQKDKNVMKKAADTLYTDYKTDTELTAFTSLDYGQFSPFGSINIII